MSDYKLNKIHLWEKLLLLFVKPSYACDNDGNIFVSTKCKKMFGKVYVLKENISIKRDEDLKTEDDYKYDGGKDE